MNFKKTALLVLGLAPLVAAVAPEFPEGTSFSQGSPPAGNAYGEEISGGGFGVGSFNLTPVPLPAS
jgi:hypothetical protein